MEGSCSTGQSPQRAVVPVEEEEEVMFVFLFNDHLILISQQDDCTQCGTVIPQTVFCSDTRVSSKSVTKENKMF
jgi:hypothetical protein